MNNEKSQPREQAAIDELPRYALVYDATHDESSMQRDDAGEWVKYDDHRAALADRQAAPEAPTLPHIPQGLAKLLRHLREEGILSEGQITQALGVDRLTCREILDEVATGAAPEAPDREQQACPCPCPNMNIQNHEDGSASCVGKCPPAATTASASILGGKSNE